MKKEIEFVIKREDAERLMLMLQEAHYQAAMKNSSISQSVFINAMTGSGNAVSSVAAALLSIGGKHAPITETRESLQMMLSDVDQFTSYWNHAVKLGGKINGLGNSFFKDRIDPAFSPVNDFLRQVHHDNDLGLTYVDSYAEIANTIIKNRRESDKDSSGELIKEEYVPLYPNAALITAAITEFLGGVPNFENWFFIAGRSRAFLEMSGKIK